MKIRGQRVELGEIEAAILAQPGISQAAVVVRCDEAGRQFLLGFYSGQPYEGRELRNQLQHHLPHYMVPHGLLYLQELPMTSSGKINRQALPDIDLTTLKLPTHYVAPQNPQEEAMAHVWEQVLEAEHVGREDNFFDLGGDSLKAIELATAAREAGLSFAV